MCPLHDLESHCMRNLAIDMGNSRVKAGLFADSQLQSVLDNPALDELPQIVENESVDRVIVCSVSSSLDDFEIKSGLNQVVKLDYRLPVPINNRYRTPQTLGMDRLAAAIGAQFLYPAANCLVIDAGTTVTYDFVDDSGKYLGGAISPGMGLRFKSLNQYTFQLPHLAEMPLDTPLIGDDTQNSIKSGVINGMIAEIQGIIRRYDEKISTLKVVMCGGDAAFFETKLKAPIFVHPHLVLIGLNSILMHHAQDK